MNRDLLQQCINFTIIKSECGCSREWKRLANPIDLTCSSTKDLISFKLERLIGKEQSVDWGIARNCRDITIYHIYINFSAYKIIGNRYLTMQGDLIRITYILEHCCATRSSIIEYRAQI
ncbi:MAG: hypothetical protein ACTSWL_01870 [Promethearchaeota archaeon]